MTVVSNLIAALRNHAAYLRTKREIEALPLNIALDLNIFRSDAARIASRAVYGA
jgi:hypothetical protein